jgi:hypothetical protein
MLQFKNRTRAVERGGGPAERADLLRNFGLAAILSRIDCSAPDAPFADAQDASPCSTNTVDSPPSRRGMEAGRQEGRGLRQTGKPTMTGPSRSFCESLPHFHGSSWRVHSCW